MLKRLVEYAGKVPSAQNLQPLRYVISNTSNINRNIFDCLKWAGYLSDWDGPEVGERPVSYIIVCADTSVPRITNMVWCDAGIACQTMLLNAVNNGYGGCILASFDKNSISQMLGLETMYEPLLIIALGRPNETIVLNTVEEDGSTRYYRDQAGTHYVPKHCMDDIPLTIFEDKK